MSYNKVILVGRLTRDPEMRTTNTGKNVAKFAIAVDKRFKPKDSNEPTADFFDVSVWGQTADYVNQYIQKGRMVLVDGRIEMRKYTDKDGQPRTAVEVTADQVTAMDRPRDEAGGSGSEGGSYNRPTSAPTGSGYGGDAPSPRSAPRAAPSAAAAADDEYDPFADN